MEQERYISVKEARAMMGVTISKMTRLIKDGAFHTKPSVIDKRKTLLPLSEVQRWMEEAKQERETEGRPAA